MLNRAKPLRNFRKFEYVLTKCVHSDLESRLPSPFFKKEPRASNQSTLELSF